MLEIVIRLLKEWNNGENDYPIGHLLKLSEEDGQKLIDGGLAEVYAKDKNDIVSVSSVSSNMSRDEIAETIKAALAENAKTHKDTKFENEAFAKTGGFVNFAHFAQHVAKAEVGGELSAEMKKWDEYVKAPSGLSENVSADGGFLVPTEFRNTLMKDSLEASIIEPRATVVPMATNSVKIPVIKESSRASSVYGGVIIYRPGEGGTKQASKPTIGNIQLNLHKLVGLCYVTDELLEDSPVSLQPLLTSMFSEAIAFQKDDDFINGNGSGQAMGVLNAGCLVTQDKIAGQPATSIVTENIFTMKQRLKARSWGRAIWLANIDTYAQLRTLSISVGTGGSLVPIFTESGGVNRLDGFPIIFTEHCQTLGTEGDIILGDWSQYLIGQKANGLQTATSIHVKFTTDETAFRFVLRYDGQPWEQTKRTPKRGNNTVSSFVSLQVRS